MTAPQDQTKPVTAMIVPMERRIAVLPAFFPGYYMKVEASVYDWMRRFCPDYRGGYWEYVTLSNGGMFLYPKRSDGGTYKLEWYGNGFTGEVSAEAAGLIMTLMAMSHLSFEIPDDRLSENFNDVREYAAQVPEAEKIFAALD